MIGYASRTGTQRNLTALRAHGWRLLVSAKGVLRHEGFPYAIDNGAWWAYANGQQFDEIAFVRAVDRLGQNADWIVVPDIVAGGLRSLDYSLTWLDRLHNIAPLLLAVQDGMQPDDVRPYLGSVGIFVGGTSEWKESTLRSWGKLAAEIRCYLHVGRVNTARRIFLCAAAGADSFDGSSISRFSCTAPELTNALAQPDLWRERQP